jgi:hypothetical protein
MPYFWSLPETFSAGPRQLRREQVSRIDELRIFSLVLLPGKFLTSFAALGTADVRYDDIGWTGPNFSSPGCVLEKVSITAGKFITSGATFARGHKDKPIYLSHGGPYLQEIHFARNINVVLYDIKDRRGWLVDGASALLHIVRTQLSSSPYCSSPLFKIEDFQHADPKSGADAARVALTDVRNTEMAIFEDVELWSESTTAWGTMKEETKRKTTKWRFRDLVRQTWHILEQIHDHQTKMLASPGIGLRFTDRDKLEGFGFMDIVSGQNPLRPRVSVLKPSGRGWVDFTRSIGAITLLGRGFGDLIMPAEGANNLCRAWERVPKDKDYLAVCTTTLREICRKNGDTDSIPLELVKGIYWYKADKLFEPCGCKSDRSSDTCDRVQVLLPPFSMGSKKYPDPFHNHKGAAIFGRSRRFDWHWPNVGNPVAGAQSEHDTDDEGNMADSGLGTSIITPSLEASRSAVSDLPPSETQAGCIPSLGGIHRGSQSVSANDSIHSDIVEPARGTVQRLISTSSSRGDVARDATHSPIDNNIAAASPEPIDREREVKAPHSPPVAPGEHGTHVTHVDNQPSMAAKTGAAWRRIKRRISRVLPRPKSKPP